MQAVKSKLNTAGTQVGGALPSAAFHENPIEASTSEDDKDGEPKKGNTSEDKQNRRAENTRDAGEATGEEAQQKLDNKVRLDCTQVHSCTEPQYQYSDLAVRILLDKKISLRTSHNCTCCRGGSLY